MKRRKEGELLGEKNTKEEANDGNDRAGASLIVLQVSDILKEDRWRPGKIIMDNLNAEITNIVAWREVDEENCELTVLNPELFSHIDITGMQEREIYQLLIDKIPDIEKSENDHLIQLDLKNEIDRYKHFMQVKSQGRVGSKKQYIEMFNDMGLENRDFLFFRVVFGDDEKPIGWNVTFKKYSDILPSEKMIVKGKMKK